MGGSSWKPESLGSSGQDEGARNLNDARRSDHCRGHGPKGCGGSKSCIRSCQASSCTSHCHGAEHQLGSLAGRASTGQFGKVRVWRAGEFNPTIGVAYATSCHSPISHEGFDTSWYAWIRTCMQFQVRMARATTKAKSLQGRKERPGTSLLVNADGALLGKNDRWVGQPRWKGWCPGPSWSNLGEVEAARGPCEFKGRINSWNAIWPKSLDWCEIYREPHGFHLPNRWVSCRCVLKTILRSPTHGKSRAGF